MKFQIYATNEKIAPYYKSAIKEYEKRLSRYCKIQYTFVKDDSSLAKKIPPTAYTIAVTQNDVSLSSENLADKISQFSISGNSNITLVICDTPIMCNETLCISNMKMSKGLTLTILFEQIYRAYRIINNQPYHK